MEKIEALQAAIIEINEAQKQVAKFPAIWQKLKQVEDYLQGQLKQAVDAIAA
jgi:hypothetical protein